MGLSGGGALCALRHSCGCIDHYRMRVMEIEGIWITARDIPALCELTGCHRTTVARWLDKGELPPPVQALLDLIYNGNLERVHPAWKGWRVNPRTGALTSPLDTRNRGLKPAEILAWPLRYQHIAALQAELRELHAERGTESELLSDESLDFDAAANLIKFPVVA